MLSKNRLLSYRNAIYFGPTLTTSNHHQLRHGIGLLISDCGSLLLCSWSHDIIHGKYFYTSSTHSAYGYINDGVYEGWNVLREKELTVWCECRAGLFHGNVVIKMGGYEPEGYQFNLGEKVKEVSLLNMSDPVKTLIKDVETNLELFIDGIINEQKYKSNLGAIKLTTVSFYGNINYQTRSGEGLGFTFVRGNITSMGTYHNTQLNGLGRRYGNNEIEDGVFVDGKLAGLMVRWNIKRDQYVKMDYSAKETLTLEKGEGNGQDTVEEIREELNLRSMNFVNDWIAIDELIKLDLSSIKISRPEAMKTRTTQIIEKLARQYLDTNEDSPNINSIKNRSPQKNRSLSYLKTVQKLTQHKIRVGQEEKVRGTRQTEEYESPTQMSRDHRYQKSLKVNEFSPVWKADFGAEDGGLEGAIREYEELQRMRVVAKR